MRLSCIFGGRKGGFKRLLSEQMANPMLFPPVLIFLGAANSIYAYLNLKLLRGLDLLAASKPTPPLVPPPSPTVTILMAARNEESRIRKCLDCLRAQDYDGSKL